MGGESYFMYYLNHETFMILLAYLIIFIITTASLYTNRQFRYILNSIEK